MLLCAGEALIDMLPSETRDGAGGFAPHAGGAVFNTAIAAARLGVQTRFFSGLSDDLFGQILTDRLRENAVNADLAKISSKPTTLAFVSLKQGQAHYVFYDENTAGRMIGPGDVPPLPNDVGIVFIGGISLAVEPCATAYAALAETARRAGKLIMIDPNIRPDFITDEPAYRARLARLLDLADIVKISDEDLAWVMGPGDIAAQAQTLCAQGPSLVLLTRGAQGATAFRASGAAVSVSAYRVDVVDTVGAGDTFNAGFLAGLMDHGITNPAQLADLGADGLRGALLLGSQAASVTVGRAGANPPTRAELAAQSL
jgi:fructokinase